MFKWLCLIVAVAGLAFFGWTMNEMRLESKVLSAKLDKQLDMLDAHMPKLLVQTEAAAVTINAHLPPLLKNSEDAAVTLKTQLPVLLKITEQTAGTINAQLPPLLASAAAAADGVADLSGSFKQYKALMGAVHAAKQNVGLFSFGSGLLSHIGKQDAVVGLKKPGSSQPLRAVQPAAEFATAAQKDVHFLSLVSGSEAEVMHGLAKTDAPVAYHIQVGKAEPVLLADWLKLTHDGCKKLK